MIKNLILFSIFLSGFLLSQGQTELSYPFQNTDNSQEDRIDDLIGRLSLEEKASLMLHTSPAIERLNIPAYNWWNECLHGVGRAGKATVFPQAIGLAATFDDDLIFRVASAISDEARAKYLTALRKNNTTQYTGLSFWSPNVNIFRDPRWGRGQETYGEDPFLTATIGKAFVRGLQGENPKYLKTAACAKHFVVHSGPEKDRHHFNVIPNVRDFRETYLPAFHSLVDAKVESVMCAYNRTYNLPCCGSSFLTNDLLREDWGFEGHIVTDCWALDDICLRHKFTKDEIESAALAVNAGINLNCGYIYKFIPEAVGKGLITETKVDEIIRPLLRTRFRLGLFDPIGMNPWNRIDESVVNSDEHRKLAYEAAAKSIVLLKNNKVLPLSRDSIRSLFVTGPTASNINALVGNYNGLSGNFSTFLEGIVDRVDAGTIVDYTQGCLLNQDSVYHGFWNAGLKDATVAFVGLTRLLEGEDGDAMLNTTGGDRVDLRLPVNQIEFVRKLHQNKGDKPLIVVITGGSAVAIPEIIELADAVLYAWYPGEAGGLAMADILFGKINPSGKLPITIYKSVNDLPAFDDYSMKQRTYKFMEKKALFPFGFGLSYGELQFKELTVTQLKNNNNSLKISALIHNNSARDVEQVVQIYVRLEDGKYFNAKRILLGFERVKLNAGESRKVNLEVDLNYARYWDESTSQYKLEPGEYILELGHSSGDLGLSQKFVVE
jgi:beta-glucosidase